MSRVADFMYDLGQAISNGVPKVNLAANLMAQLGVGEAEAYKILNDCEAMYNEGERYARD